MTVYHRHWRWFVLAILFYATFLNYLDRQTLSVALQPVAAEFKLDLAQRTGQFTPVFWLFAGLLTLAAVCVWRGLRPSPGEVPPTAASTEPA